jgi:hypothetical protein
VPLAHVTEFVAALRANPVAALSTLFFHFKHLLKPPIVDTFFANEVIGPFAVRTVAVVLHTTNVTLVSVVVFCIHFNNLLK